MRDDLEKNFYIKVVEFGLKKPDGFSDGDIIDNKALELKDWEKEILRRYLENAKVNYKQTGTFGKSGHSETLFSVIKNDKDGFKYSITFDTYFKYYDYLELKFARENAESAKKLATWALGLSIISIIVAVSIPFLITQTIKLNSNQFNEIKTFYEGK